MNTDTYKLTPVTENIKLTETESYYVILKGINPFITRDNGEHIKAYYHKFESVFIPIPSEEKKDVTDAVEFAEWVLQKEFIPVNELEDAGEYWSVLFDGRYTINNLYQLFLSSNKQITGKEGEI